MLFLILQIIIDNRGEFDPIAKRITAEKPWTTRDCDSILNRVAGGVQSRAQCFKIIDFDAKVPAGMIGVRFLSEQMEFDITQTIPENIEMGDCRGRGYFFKPEQRSVKGAGGFIAAGWTRNAHVLHSWTCHKPSSLRAERIFQGWR